jgi:hypothetical protein
VSPGVEIGNAAPAAPQPAPIQQAQRPAAIAPTQTSAAARPGFDF